MENRSNMDQFITQCVADIESGTASGSRSFHDVVLNHVTSATMHPTESYWNCQARDWSEYFRIICNLEVERPDLYPSMDNIDTMLEQLESAACDWEISDRHCIQVDKVLTAYMVTLGMDLEHAWTDQWLNIERPQQRWISSKCIDRHPTTYEWEWQVV